jgi:hypothetical protein
LNVGEDYRKPLIQRWESRISDEFAKPDAAAAAAAAVAYAVQQTPQLHPPQLSAQCCPRDLFDSLAAVVFHQLSVDVLPRFVMSKEFARSLGNLILTRGLRDAVFETLDGKLRTATSGSPAGAAAAASTTVAI